jgi:peroxiredoxin
MRLLLPMLVVALAIGVPATAFAQTGQKAPDFSLKTVDNKDVTLSELKGKVVLINFWATWCGPCVREIPDFLEVYDDYKEKGFEIIGVSLDRGGWKTVTPFVEKMKMTYPVVMGNGEVVKDYGNFNAIPTSFFVDKNGIVVDQHTGTMTKADLVAKLKKLL